MATLKLERLPDRAPVKLTILLPPDLSSALADYAEAYQDAYGEAEPVTELIPAMLWAFLQSDRGFARSRKSRRDRA
ncbi:MAG TPA: DUF2274 domain-containing protein [Sphingomicrobium sp.]|nr:DUF2274 domain-containing protein [Sphingomicrobium sp.]